MTPDEAERVASILVVATNGWSDPKVAWWCQRLEQLGNFQVATQVANRIVDTHTAPGPPAWATFMQAYQSEVRTENSRTRGLPEGRVERISFAEFIHRTRTKAEQGDSEAHRQLATLDRIANRPRDKSRPAWIEALNPNGDTA